MKLLKFLVIGLLGLAVVVVAGSFLLASSVSMERSIVIDRPASVVYPLVSDYRRFNEWSPWAELDPATTYELSSPTNAVGSKFAWSSNDPSVGKGSQTITALTPNQRVETALDFGDQGQANSYVQLSAEGAGTKVNWGFKSDLHGIVERWFGLLIPSMVAPDYEKGLAKLKQVAEALPNVDVSKATVETVDLSPLPAYAIAAEAGVDAASSTEVLTAAYGEILTFMAANGIQQAGPVYTKILGHSGDTWRFEASIPAIQNDAAPTGRIVATQSFGGKALRFEHVGSYDDLAKTHALAEAYLAVHKLTEVGSRYEIYVSDPANTPVEQLQTQILVPFE
ncbi:SRPBCC family protein [Ahniella affigens]|nr:SRPBCC family protein [Ahniella affigens]